MSESCCGNCQQSDRKEVLRFLRFLIASKKDAMTVDCGDTVVWASDWVAVLGEVVRGIENLEVTNEC